MEAEVVRDPIEVDEDFHSTGVDEFDEFIQSNPAGDYEVRVVKVDYDDGRARQSEQYRVRASEFEADIELQVLPPGDYLLKLYREGQYKRQVAVHHAPQNAVVRPPAQSLEGIYREQIELLRDTIEKCENRNQELLLGILNSRTVSQEMRVVQQIQKMLRTETPEKRTGVWESLLPAVAELLGNRGGGGSVPATRYRDSSLDELDEEYSE